MKKKANSYLNELSIQDFKSSLKNGTGLALLCVKNKNFVLTGKYKQAILNACIKNLGYDQQVETDRAYYMYEVIKYSKNSEYFIGKLYQTFRNNLIIRDWNEYHRFKILSLTAKYENASLKPLIYKIFANNIPHSYEMILREDLMEMDGYKAAVFIIESVGSYMEKDNSYYEDREFIKSVERKFKPGFVKHLNKLAKGSSSTLRYLDVSLNNELNKKPFEEKRNLSYDEIEEIVNNTKKAMLFIRKWKISKYNLKKLAGELLREKNKNRLKNYLKIFWYREFPLNIEPVIKLARSRNLELSSSAKTVLANVKNKRIREFAIEQLSNYTRAYEISDNIELLKLNYRRKDKRLFEKLLNKNYNHDISHSIMSSMLDVLGNNKSKDCSHIFKEIYKKLNCMSCREKLINILIKEKMLRGKILRESLFDANQDIRINVKRYVRNSATYN